MLFCTFRDFSSIETRACICFKFTKIEQSYVATVAFPQSTSLAVFEPVY
jgi:hypothetical protein